MNDETSGPVIARNGDLRYVLIALSLIGAFLCAEVVAAVLGSSLVLFADAGHMVTDVSALAMSAWALRLVRRPAAGRWTFGFHRAEVLSAAVNGVTLVAVGLLIAVEAIQRLIAPRPVNGPLIFSVAIVGALVNVASVYALARANHTSLNIRGAYAHVMTDLYAFIGTAIAGLVVIVDGLAARGRGCVPRRRGADGAFRVGSASRRGKSLARGDARRPRPLATFGATSRRVNHVLEVHDLHAWSVASDFTTLSAHVVVEQRCFDDGHAPQILDALQTLFERALRR